MPDIRLAKLSRPRLGPSEPRERLFQRLDACRNAAPALWISGPPGAGKTTLVAQYVSVRRLTALWYLVDPGDGDPASFFYHLGLAARQPGVSRKIRLPLLTPEFMPDLAGFARRFFRSLFQALPRPAALVFDNLQEAPEASPFAGLIQQAIAEAPDGVQVMLVSRNEPPAGSAPPIAHIGWAELRLTAQEGARIAAAALPDHPLEIDRLVERCDGWAAGLTMLVQRARSSAAIAEAGLPLEPGQALFDYFAAELFEQMPPQTRHLLLRTALLPWVDPESAELLSGNRRASSLLDELHRQHLFVERREGSRKAYRYHALFREFLIARMRATSTPSEHLALALESARWLEAAGEADAALRLYLEANDAAGAVRLALTQAPELAAQGRLPTLAVWISMLPASRVAEEPWLGYWQGMCVFGMNPPLARQRLQAAYEGFAARDDILGQTLAAAGIVETLYVEYRDFTATDRWTAALRDLLSRRPAFPHPGVELGVLASLLGALAMRQQHPDLLVPHARRMQELLDMAPDVNARLFGAARLLHYAVFFEGHPLAQRLVTYLEPQLQDPAVAPLNACMALHMLGLNYLYSAYDAPRSTHAMEQAVELMESNGLQFLSILFLSLAALARLGTGAVDAGAAHLARVVPALGGSTFDMGWYDGMQSYLALLRGQAPAALHHAQRLVEANASSGMQHGLGMALLLRANALAAGGDLPRALDDVERAKRHITPVPFGQFSIALVEGDLRLAGGDAASAVPLLRRAFAIGREAGLRNTMQWLPAQMSRLCAHALAHDIEPAYVRDLIRARGLLPPEADAPEWPWPVRIRCVGPLAIECDGVPVRLDSRAQRKPLVMLKVLLALGARSVPEDKLIEAVWQKTADADEHKTFDVTVHRLRRLLGHERSVLVSDRRVSLNPDVVWLDLWALEPRLAAPQPVGPEPAAVAAELERAAPSVLELYRGRFLSGEADSAWILPARNRLGSRFQRFVLQLGEHWELSGQPARAAALYERAFAIEPQAELFSRRRGIGPGES